VFYVYFGGFVGISPLFGGDYRGMYILGLNHTTKGYKLDSGLQKSKYRKYLDNVRNVLSK